MDISENGIDLIKKFEGCKLTSYQDQVGVWTIGYGSTDGVSPNMTITQEEADSRLCEYLNHMCSQLNELISEKITQNQFDAICSFTYNLGIGAFRRSTLLTCINEGDLEKASNEFLKWAMAGGHINQGLLRRRQAERELFLS